ncbi:BLUF domain-containing protein [Pelagibius litoralis]|uniref:BLUF domain-containing protein n=1 Tax=Pelagibius litoralis TaxID=374515 RepID=A0A967F0D0_9PROT|nr:BLUF domain-containing protein [Pelagibius litoralis]NIA70760.1 BLUF domain-containing protein [Pelagibius litoralis]
MDKTLSEQAALPVYRLMYLSAAKHEMGAEELETILSTARNANAAKGITGMLLYVERQFLQYLEGEQEAVETLYRNIEKDPRHSGVIRLFAGPCARRVFADWSMGYHHCNAKEQEAAIGIIDLCRRSVRDVLPAETPEEIVAFMESFYRNSHSRRRFS